LIPTCGITQWPGCK